MEIEIKFRAGEDPQKKLKNALICAEELNSVNCPWHNSAACVEVSLDSKGDLKWNIYDYCCDNLKNEIVKAINEVSSRL